MLRGRPEKGWNLFHNTYSTFLHCHPKGCLWNWDNVTFFFFHFLHLGFPNNGGCICLCICVFVFVFVFVLMLRAQWSPDYNLLWRTQQHSQFGMLGKLGMFILIFSKLPFLLRLPACPPEYHRARKRQKIWLFSFKEKEGIQSKKKYIFKWALPR